MPMIDYLTNQPSHPGIWYPVWEDDFGGGELDDDYWTKGEWGWGSGTNNGNCRGRPDLSYVDPEAEVLVLECECEGGEATNDSPDHHDEHAVGVVNTKDKVTFEPGNLLEARIRCADLPGTNNSWWSKADLVAESWPPEIDVMEVPTDRPTESMHNIHYSRSGWCGDSTTHASASNGFYGRADDERPGTRRSERFFVYKLAWESDRIAHYVDGDLVGETTDPTVLESLSSCDTPHYMMFSLLVGEDPQAQDGFPPTDERGPVPPCSEWDRHKTTMEIDYVRIWERIDVVP